MTVDVSTVLGLAITSSETDRVYVSTTVGEVVVGPRTERAFVGTLIAYAVVTGTGLATRARPVMVMT